MAVQAVLMRQLHEIDPTAFPAEACTPERFAWAHQSFWSRALRVPGDGRLSDCLVTPNPDPNPNLNPNPNLTLTLTLIGFRIAW